ncbi:hypothetical protein PC116_g17707 [Phytophthora cactorum]|nr:hypothetical protein PC118_g17961 [Phytophthora cactorum]KAG4234122.1 hypothetical protein PC116_g17707 [Phytophthora cactorum]
MLCTVHSSQVVVEVCNASTEEVIVKAEAVVAMEVVVPETAFEGKASPSFNMNEVDIGYREPARASERRPGQNGRGSDEEQGRGARRRL